MLRILLPAGRFEEIDREIGERGRIEARFEITAQRRIDADEIDGGKPSRHAPANIFEKEHRSGARFPEGRVVGPDKVVAAPDIVEEEGHGRRSAGLVAADEELSKTVRQSGACYIHDETVIALSPREPLPGERQTVHPVQQFDVGRRFDNESGADGLSVLLSPDRPDRVKVRVEVVTTCQIKEGGVPQLEAEHAQLRLVVMEPLKGSQIVEVRRQAERDPRELPLQFFKE
jgi:hypothetical protein